MANKAVWGGYRNTVSEWSDDDSDADDERPAERAAKRQRTSPSQQLPQAQQQQARQQHGQQHGQGQQQKQALLKPPAQPGQSGRQTLQQKQAPQRQQLQKPAPPPPQQQSNVTQEQQVPKRAKLSPQGSAQHMVLPSPATKSGGHKTPGSAGGVGGGARPTPHLQPSPMELDTAPRSLSGVRPQPATIPRQRGGRPPLPPKQQQIPAADGRCPYQPPNQPAPKSPPAPSLLSGPSRKQQGAGGAAAAAAAGGKAADLAAGSGSAGSWRTAGAALLASKETQGELARMHRRSNDAWMSADSLSEDTQRLSLGPSGNAISAAEDLQKRSHVGLTANESACKHARHVANACFKAVHPHDAPINLVSGGGSQQPQLSAQEQLQQAADELDAAYERLQTGEPFDAQLQQQLQLLRDGVQALRQPVPTYDALTEVGAGAGYEGCSSQRQLQSYTCIAR